MKHYIYIWSSFLVLACGPSKTKENTVIAEKPVQNPTLVTNPSGEGMSTNTPTELVLYPYSNPQRIDRILGFLSSDELQGREAGSEGIEKAAVFIEERLKDAGVLPFYGSFRDTLSNFSPTAFNIVGVVEGNDPQLKNEYVIIGAHYDHIGVVEPVGGDNIANGANDNASGSTAILEMANYFGENKTNKRSLIFAWFSAEEKGLLGSKHLAAKLKTENLDLYAMLNFEMVGVPLRNQDYFMYITGFDMSNLAEIANTYAQTQLIGFLPTAKSYNLFKRSDNYPFSQEFGVPAHTFCTFDFTNFDFYHQPGDELGKMDVEHMAQVVNRSIPVIEGIANSATRELKMTE